MNRSLDDPWSAGEPPADIDLHPGEWRRDKALSFVQFRLGSYVDCADGPGWIRFGVPLPLAKPDDRIRFPRPIHYNSMSHHHHGSASLMVALLPVLLGSCQDTRTSALEDRIDRQDSRIEDRSERRRRRAQAEDERYNDWYNRIMGRPAGS